MYTFGHQKQINQWIYQQPDSSSTSLVNDQISNISFSTFVNENTILMKIGDEFLIFDQNGVFQTIANFDKDKYEPSDMHLISMSNNGKYFLFNNDNKSLELHQLEFYYPAKKTG
jgi:hypothetical protein